MHGLNFCHVKEIEKGSYRENLVQVGRQQRWVSARPFGYTGIKHRLMGAWLVFIGRVDVLYWDEQ